MALHPQPASSRPLSTARRAVRPSVAAMIACVGLGVVLASVPLHAAPPPPASRRPRPQQPATPPPATPDPNAPATPAPGTPTAPSTPAPGAPAAPGTQPSRQPRSAAPATLPVEIGPYVTRSNERHLTINADITIRAAQDPGDGQRMPRFDVWQWQTMGVVFPVVPWTAGHAPEVVSRNGRDEPRFSGELKVADRTVASSGRLLGTVYHSGARLAQWDAPAGEAREVTLSISVPVTLYRTTLDEEKAMQVPWPTTAWPEEAASTFGPQLFVDQGPNPADAGKIEPYDPLPVAGLVDRWLRELNVRDPKEVPPLRLAKMLAGRFIETFQVSGEGLSFNRNGTLEGVVVQPPPLTVAAGRGTEFDLVALLAAVYRRVGIPARTVIGVDAGGDGRTFLDKGDRARLRAWVEVAIYDEVSTPGKGLLNWVPVDIAELRRKNSRPQPLDRPWRYFGTHDELDRVVPFSFHFHPPTTVRAYGTSGFWGWMITPSEPAFATQQLRFQAQVTAQRSGDRREQRQRGR